MEKGNSNEYRKNNITNEKSYKLIMPPIISITPQVEENINYIKSQTLLPVFAGFGIKTPDDAFNLSKISDGIVIGSSLVEMIHEQSSQKEFKKIYNYLHEISEAINR